MKNIIILALLALSFSALATQPLMLDKQVFQAWREPFKYHQGESPFTNYLTMEIPFTPIRKLFNQVQDKAGMKLSSRGEAHITVITPPEFDNYLKPSGVSINEIDAIALKYNIQKAPFQIGCLGAGTAMKTIGGVKTKAIAFYLLVRSQVLNQIRMEVYRLAKKKDPYTKFDPTNFYPHITVAYLNDDVHESDGLIKDARTCIASVVIH